MLNARPEVVKNESRVIAQAGLPGMVTVATRMAGRGTDILLGGNPRGLVENALFKGVLDHLLPDSNQTTTKLAIRELDLHAEDSAIASPTIKGLMTAALSRGQASEELLETAEDAEKLMNHVMTVTESLKRDVHDRVQEWVRFLTRSFVEVIFTGQLSRQQTQRTSSNQILKRQFEGTSSRFCATEKTNWRRYVFDDHLPAKT